VLVITNDEIKHSVGKLVEADEKKDKHRELVPKVKEMSKAVDKQNI
jgi:hypothetical protein